MGKLINNVEWKVVKNDRTTALKNICGNCQASELCRTGQSGNANPYYELCKTKQSGILIKG